MRERAPTLRARSAQALRASGAFDAVQNGDNAAWADAGRVPVRASLPAEPGGRRRSASPPTACATRSTTRCRCSARRPARCSSRCWSATRPARPLRIAEALTAGAARRAPKTACGSRARRRARCCWRRPRPPAPTSTRRSGRSTRCAAAFAARARRPACALDRERRAGVRGRRRATRSRREVAAARDGSAACVIVVAAAGSRSRRRGAGDRAAAGGDRRGRRHRGGRAWSSATCTAMTLGFGTTLIGEAVDYAIYYLIQARARPCRQRRARWRATRSWPTVRLGLLTSVCGFAALRVLGLSRAGAARRVLDRRPGRRGARRRATCCRCWPDGASGRAGRATARARRCGARGSRCRARAGRSLALSAAAVLVLAVHRDRWRADLSSTEPGRRPTLVRLDAELRADIGASDAGTLVVVPAPTEQALRRAEAAGARLDALVDAGALRGYDSVARLLPSVRDAAARRAACPMRRRCARLAEATARRSAAGRAAGALRRRRAGRTRAGAARPRRARAARALAPRSTRCCSSARRGLARTAEPAAGERAPIDAARLRSRLATCPAPRSWTSSRELDALYAHYLHEAFVQVMAGARRGGRAAGLRLRSARRLRRCSRRSRAPSCWCSAALALAGTALGILHLVGLLLVVAVGSNYALFFDQLRETPAATRRATRWPR